MKRNWKVLIPHHKGCRAEHHVKERRWGTPWAYLQEIEHRDASGRLSRHGTRWWRTRCNSTDCPAVMVINETFLLEQCKGSGVSASGSQT
jgi:hypothetical protein